jgi:hypothetical protein
MREKQARDVFVQCVSLITPLRVGMLAAGVPHSAKVKSALYELHF